MLLRFVDASGAPPTRRARVAVAADLPSEWGGGAGRRWGEPVLGRGVRRMEVVRLPVVGPWDSTG